MTLPRRTYLLAPLIATMLAALPFATASYAAPREDKSVPACSKAAAPAKDVLIAHNKHCLPPAPPPPPPPPPQEEEPAPPPPPPPPPPEEPPPPPCNEAAPSQLLATSLAGPYTVTKLAANSLAVMHPGGGLNAATELDVEVGGTGYGFTKGSIVPWFTLPWGEFEVRIQNWEHFADKVITAVQFYQYPYPGPLFGGWHQLERPIVMGAPAADGC